MWSLRREMHSCKWMHMVWWCMMVYLMVAMVWTTHFWKACVDGLLLGERERERERVRVTVTINQGRSRTFFFGGYNWNQLTHGHVDFVLQHEQSAVYCVLFLNVITSSCCIIPPTLTFNYTVTIPLHPQSWGYYPLLTSPSRMPRQHLYDWWHSPFCRSHHSSWGKGVLDVTLTADYSDCHDCFV